MPWNPKRNGFYRSALRGLSWCVAGVAAVMAWNTKDIVGGALAASLIIHLLTTAKTKGRKS